MSLGNLKVHLCRSMRRGAIEVLLRYIYIYFFFLFLFFSSELNNEGLPLNPKIRRNFTFIVLQIVVVVFCVPVCHA